MIACMRSMPSEFSLSFIEKKEIAKDTYSFFFDRSSQPDYSFSPGQYVRIILDLPKLDIRGKSRMFTVSSSPGQKDVLVITTKILKNPSIFKQRMIGLKNGEEVKFFGPMGAFTLPDKSKRPLVFLSGGIGITPFHSMILHAVNQLYPVPITLIASFSYREEVIFYEEFEKIANKNPKIKVVYTLSQGDSLDIEERGRISEKIIKNNILNISYPEYFICGSSLMVASSLELLESMDIPMEQVREEQMTGY